MLLLSTTREIFWNEPSLFENFSVNFDNDIHKPQMPNISDKPYTVIEN